MMVYGAVAAVFVVALLAGYLIGFLIHSPVPPTSQYTAVPMGDTDWDDEDLKAIADAINKLGGAR